MGNIYKIAPSTQFTQVANELVRDVLVSESAFRLIAWIQSHSNNFNISFSGIKKLLGWGRDKIRSAIANAEQNEYLVRIRHQSLKTGLFSWDYYVFATKQDCKSFKHSLLVDHPGVANPPVDNPSPDKYPHIRIQNTEQQVKNTPPLSPREREEKEVVESSLTDPTPHYSVSAKELTDLEIQPTNSSAIATPPADENHSQKFDPFFNQRRSRNDVVWDWLPDGPWRVEGKLDYQFHNAIAQKWLKEYGGDIHEKKANVLKHFRNDPTNLPIEWEWYYSQFLHRAANIQTRKANELDTTEDEEKLMQQVGAIAPMDEEQQISTPVDPVTQIKGLGYEVESSSSLSNADPPTEVFQASQEDRDFWGNTQFVNPQKSDRLHQKNTPEELAAAKQVIEGLKATRKRGNPRGEGRSTPTPLSQVLDHDQWHQHVLADMQKYLVSGNDDLRQQAIDWACNPDNGCELIKKNGRVIGIKEVDF